MKKRKLVLLIIFVSCVVVVMLYLMSRKQHVELNSEIKEVECEVINADRVAILIYPDSSEMQYYSDQMPDHFEGLDNAGFHFNNLLMDCDSDVGDFKFLESNLKKSIRLLMTTQDKIYVINGDTFKIKMSDYPFQYGILMVNKNLVRNFVIRSIDPHKVVSIVDSLDRYLRINVEDSVVKYSYLKRSKKDYYEYLNRKKNELSEALSDKCDSFQYDIEIADSLLLRQREILKKINKNMMFVKGGSFRMGSTKIGDEWFYDEFPVRKVDVNDFLINKFELTQEEWLVVAGYNPFKPYYFPNCPAVNISYCQVVDFINKLNELDGSSKFRLPTEQEWEYAAKSGPYKENYVYAGSDDYNEVGASKKEVYMCDSCYFETIGSKAPNKLGLYDMSGNVLEICAPPYKLYPTIYKRLVLHGYLPNMVPTRSGSLFFDHVDYIAQRSFVSRNYKSYLVGFRLAKST